MTGWPTGRVEEAAKRFSRAIEEFERMTAPGGDGRQLQYFLGDGGEYALAKTELHEAVRAMLYPGDPDGACRGLPPEGKPW